MALAAAGSADSVQAAFLNDLADVHVHGPTVRGYGMQASPTLCRDAGRELPPELADTGHTLGWLPAGGVSPRGRRRGRLRGPARSEAAGEEEWAQPGLLIGNRFAALANDDAPQRLVPGEPRWKAGKGKGMSQARGAQASMSQVMRFHSSTRSSGNWCMGFRTGPCRPYMGISSPLGTGSRGGCSWISRRRRLQFWRSSSSALKVPVGLRLQALCRQALLRLVFWAAGRAAAITVFRSAVASSMGLASLAATWVRPLGAEFPTQCGPCFLCLCCT